MDFADLGGKPIPGSAPAGQDVRSDPDFEALAAEVEKLSSPTLSGIVDWKKIAILAAKILEEKGKDLLVMSYLCAALEKNDGLRGLAEGIHILRQGVETFWEDMFPAKKRMRGRKNAVDWLADRLRDEVPSLGQEEWKADDRAAFLEDFNALDRFLSDNMEDAPILVPIINEVSGRVVTAQEAAPVPPPATPPSSPPPQPASPGQAAKPGQAPAVVPDFTPADGDAEKTLGQAFDVLARISTVLAGLDPLNPIPYRLNRIAAWAEVRDLPPSSGSTTLIPAPDSQVVSALQNLYKTGSWRELLPAAESRVREFLFWLDLSRYAAESLEQLGCREGVEAIEAEILLYARRLPGVERLCFDDGTPFAEETTRSWLVSLQEKQETAATKGIHNEGSMQDKVEEALTEARKLARENKATEALRQLNDELSRAPSVRERFLWQQGLSRLFFETGHPRLALPQMQEMLAAVDTYKVEQWEPGLAVEAFTTILTGLRLQPEKDQAQVESVLDRLARLDPVKALDFV